MSSLSAQIPGLFQNAFQSSLLTSASRSSLDTLGSMANSFGVVGGSLGGGGLTGGGLTGGGLFGGGGLTTAGSSAVSGINDFVSQIMYTSQLRKLGLLPSGSNSFGGFGGGFSSFGGGFGGFGQAAVSPEQQMLGQLMTLFTMLQAAMGGQAVAQPQTFVQPQAFVQQPQVFSQAAINPFQSTLTGGAGTALGSGFSTGSGLGGGLLGSGLGSGLGSALGSFVQPAVNIFSSVADNFSRIDNAIGSALGGILSTLPLAKL